MLSRRCRIQARPNVKPSITGSKRPAKEALPTVAQPTAYTTKPNECAPAVAATAVATNPTVSNDKVDGNGNGEDARLSISNAEEQSSRILSGESEMRADTAFKPVEGSTNSHSVVEEAANVNRGSQGIVSPEKSAASSSTTTNRSCSPIQSPPLKRKPRRKFTGEEPLDPKTMTMSDLIFWNPKNDTMMKYHVGKRSRKSSVATTASNVSAADKDVATKEEDLAMPAPKVRIAEDGTLVLDESSLTVAQEKFTNIWETVDEDRVVRKISSLSFRKSALRRSAPWTSLETDLFYVILRATGPDFGLMHEFFPSRSRSELKSKFNREERTNWDRLKHSMSMPTLLDDALYDEANRLLKKISDEALKKKEKVQGPKKSKTANDEASIGWDENEADLVAEAEEEIQRMENENRKDDKNGEDGSNQEKKTLRRSARLSEKLKAKIINETSKEAKRLITDKIRNKYDEEAKQLQGSAVAGLSPQFPVFKIKYNDDASTVSIELDEERIPIVTVPQGTLIHVLPEDDKQPERVLFECFDDTKTVARRYIVKHQSGPGEQSSGFLHLFGAVS